MISPNSNADNSPEPREKDIVPPPLPKKFRLLASVFILTIAVDLLTYGIPLGAGVTILCVLIWLGLKLNLLGVPPILLPILLGLKRRISAAQNPPPGLSNAPSYC